MLEHQTNIGNDVLPDSAEPFFNPPELDHVVGNIRILEEWYSTTYRRRITEITQLLSNQITEELRCQYEQERRPLIEPDPDHGQSNPTSIH